MIKSEFKFQERNKKFSIYQSLSDSMLRVVRRNCFVNDKSFSKHWLFSRVLEQ